MAPPLPLYKLKDNYNSQSHAGRALHVQSVLETLSSFKFGTLGLLSALFQRAFSYVESGIDVAVANYVSLSSWTRNFPRALRLRKRKAQSTSGRNDIGHWQIHSEVELGH